MYKLSQFSTRESRYTSLKCKTWCIFSEEDGDSRFYYGETSQRSNGPPLYPHNTYHGPGLGYNHHQRTPLATANFRPLKFTDNYSPRASPHISHNGDSDEGHGEVWEKNLYEKWPLIIHYFYSWLGNIRPHRPWPRGPASIDLYTSLRPIIPAKAILWTERVCFIKTI